MRRLAESFARYTEALRRAGSVAPDHLLSGWESDAVRAALADSPAAITRDLVEYFGLQGGIDGSRPLGSHWLVPGFVPLGVTDAVQAARLYSAAPDWSEAWLPIFEDQAGWFYVRDTAADVDAVRLVQLDLGASPIVFSSISNMLDTHRDALVEGALRVDSEGVLWEESEAFAIVARRHEPSLAWWSS